MRHCLGSPAVLYLTITAALVASVGSSRAQELALLVDDPGLPPIGPVVTSDPAPDPLVMPPLAATDAAPSAVVDLSVPDQGDLAPRWSVEAGVLFLGRNAIQPANYRDDLELGSAGGLLLDVHYRFTEDWLIEGRMFGPNLWDAHETYSYYGTIEYRYQSELESFEINLLRRARPRLDWTIGLRGLQLEEGFSYCRRYPYYVLNDYAYFTRNDLFGIQGGAHLRLFGHGRRFRVDANGKAGALYALIEQYTATRDSRWTLPFIKDQRASFVGEAGLGGAWDVRDWLTLHAGFEVLCLWGVALAPSQRNGPDSNDTAFYYGPYASLEGRW